MLRTFTKLIRLISHLQNSFTRFSSRSGVFLVTGASGSRYSSLSTLTAVSDLCSADSPYLDVVQHILAGSQPSAGLWRSGSPLGFCLRTSTSAGKAVSSGPQSQHAPLETRRRSRGYFGIHAARIDGDAKSVTCPQ